jgi:heme-degrading monooxygenase HmoA
MSVHRIDRFVVPDAALDEFLADVARTHDLLRGLPGYRRDLLLEGERTGGTTRILTAVEWADEDAVAGAIEVVRRAHTAAGFSPREATARLGISADLGLYRARPWPTGR